MIKTNRGDSPAISQVTKVTPANVAIGDTFTITCNGKSVSYVALNATNADVVNGLIAALAATTIAEFQEFTFASGTDANGNTVLLLTAGTPGYPFSVTCSTIVTTLGSVVVTETTAGKIAVNEVHSIALTGTYTGGTFTITYAFGTTAAIAYSATAGTVQTAIAALAGVGAGQVLVLGGPGPSTPWIVEWTGTLAGTAIATGTINGGSLTGNGGVQITHTQPGVGASNAIQQIDLSGCTGGSYTLTFAGQTTSTLSFGTSTAANIQTALQALSAIGSGNCTVYGDPSNVATANHNTFFVLFAGALAGSAVSLITVNGANLIGNATSMSLQLGGQSSCSGWQLVDVGFNSTGSFALTYGANTTAAIPVTPASGSFATAVYNALAALPSPNVVAVYSGNFITGQPSQQCLVKFGSTSPAPVPVLVLNTAGLAIAGGTPALTILDQGLASLNDVQKIVIAGTGGTFTLTCNAQTTIATAWNASTATVVTNIETAFTTTLTTVTCSGAGTLASPYVVTTTAPAATLIPTFTGNGASLTGGGGAITEVAHGGAAVNEVQTVTLGAGWNAGTFTLSFNGALSTAIAYNASSATVQTDLQAVTTIGASNATVTGSAGGPWTVTFAAALAGAPQNLLVGNGTNLTGATGAQTLTPATNIFSSGPNHYNDPLNWSPAGVPNTGDQVVYNQGNTSCLYGLNQISTFTWATGPNLGTWAAADLLNGQIVYVNTTTTLPSPLAVSTPYYLVNVSRDAGTFQLATSLGGSPISVTTTGTGTHTVGVRLDSLEISARWTGELGLSRISSGGYIEYRPRYLHVGMQTVAQGGLQTVTIGTDVGSGQGKVQIDNDVDQALWTVIQTGTSLDTDARDVLLKGQNSNNTLNVVAGDVAVALFEGETATLASITQRGGTLELGPGVTVTGPLTRSGGTLICDGCTLNGVITL